LEWRLENGGSEALEGRVCLPGRGAEPGSRDTNHLFVHLDFVGACAAQNPKRPWARLGGNEGEARFSRARLARAPMWVQVVGECG
jgi:hypothetical protein